MYFKTLEEMIQANKNAGYHFWGDEEIKNFKSITHTNKPMQGRFIITSEQSHGPTSRRYVLRFFQKTCQLHSLCEYDQFRTEREALNLYNELPADIVKGLDLLFESYIYNYDNFEKHLKDEKSEYHSICNYLFDNKEKLKLTFHFPKVKEDTN